MLRHHVLGRELLVVIRHIGRSVSQIHLERFGIATIDEILDAGRMAQQMCVQSRHTARFGKATHDMCYGIHR